MAACWVFLSVAASGQEPERRYDINIPATRADVALKSLARQAETQLLFSYDLAKTVQANPVSGRYTLSEALEQLLRGTGLSSSLTKSGVITVTSTSTIARREPENDMNTKKASSVLGSIAAFLGFGLTPHQGQAQAAQPSAELEEIIVTAQRREEAIDKVPVSMTAFSQKTMDDLHIQSLGDLATIVPGVDIPPQNGAGNANSDIAIRGIFSNGNAPTTQIYIDETPIAIRNLGAAGPTGSFFPTIFDLDRVEVLRGPQGTLFGSSAMGGAIRFITPDPNLQEASGYSKLEIADTDHGDPSYTAGVAYGAPIVQGTAGYRVSGWFNSAGGFIDAADPFTGQIVKHDANSSDSFGGRAALTILPTDGLKITPSVFVQHKHSDDVSAYWGAPDLGNRVSGDSPSQPATDSLTVLSLAIEYELPGMVLRSDSSYLDRWFDVYNDSTNLIEAFYAGQPAFAGQPGFPALSPAFRIWTEQRGGTRGWSQQLRLTSSEAESPIKWVIGVNFHRAVENNEQLITPDLSPLTEAIAGIPSLPFFMNIPNYVVNGHTYNGYANFFATDEQEAVFGDVTVNLTKKLKANIGLRVEHSAVEDQQQIIAGPLNGVTFSNAVLPDELQNPITPRFGLTYQYTDSDMVYISAAKGYRSGGGNAATTQSSTCLQSLGALGLTSSPATFNSDSLWTYEVGAKDQHFNGRLATQVSVFYVDWTNIQTNIFLPSCDQSFTTNRGRAVVQGFDAQLSAIPFDNLKLGANVSYTEGYYPNAQLGAPVAGVAPLLNGAGDKLGAGGEGFGSSVLPWSASAQAEYSWSVDALWSGARSYFRADYRWLDGQPSGNPHVANFFPLENELRNPAYSTVNLRLGLTRFGLDLSVFVNNATNSNPRLNGQTFTTSFYYFDAIRPLTAGLTALYRF
jgi:iron complex outermembrane receptor protein